MYIGCTFLIVAVMMAAANCSLLAKLEGRIKHLEDHGRAAVSNSAEDPQQRALASPDIS